MEYIGLLLFFGFMLLIRKRRTKDEWGRTDWRDTGEMGG